MVVTGDGTDEPSGPVAVDLIDAADDAPRFF
jgi:hypothetical protein